MNLESYKNKLIVFEGYEKTGKTSVAKEMANLLNDHNIETIFTFQPGDTAWGVNAALFRSLCIDKRHELHPISNLFAFLLDRAEQTSKVIVPALKSGKTVISDRWWYSTLAYQFAGKELQRKYFPNDSNFANNLNEMASMWLKPDIVYYFPETLAVEREIDDNDQFETASNSFEQRVRDEYEKLANENNFIRVSPGSSVLETLSNILSM